MAGGCVKLHAVPCFSLFILLQDENKAEAWRRRGAHLLFGKQHSFLGVDLLEEVSTLTVVHHNVQAAALCRKVHKGCGKVTYTELKCSFSGLKLPNN